MNEKAVKRFDKATKIISCVFGLVGGLAATYFLVPKRNEVIDLGNEVTAQPIEDTYFAKFVTRLTGSIGNDVSEENAFPALSADFEDFEISWPNNKIAIDGNLKLSIQGLNNLDLSLDVDVDYNGKKVDLGLGFVDKTLYLALMDLRLKQSFVETSEVEESGIVYMLDQFMDNFFNVDNPDGLQIKFDLIKNLDNLLGNIDLSSLTNGTDLKVTETIVGDDVDINLDITMGGDEGAEPTKLGINILMNKDTLGLKKVDLGTIKLGDVEIKGKLNCESEGVRILGLDDPEYPRKRGEFTEIISYSRWMDKIFDLLKTRRIGLDIAADLKMHENNQTNNLGLVNISADLDASELFDLTGFNLDGLINGEDVGSIIKADPSATPELNNILSIFNRFDFNIGIDIGNIVDGEVVDYSNLGVAYYTDEMGHNAGYLSFNEDEDGAVMRAKIDVETINYLIDKIPGLIDSINGSKKSPTKAANEEEAGLFDFVTSSELVTAINEGHYENIIDLIETLKSTEKTIEIVLNLSSLGFGMNSKVCLILDASEDGDSPTKIISIVAENVNIGSLELNAEIYTRPYNEEPLNYVKSISNKYDHVDFVPGVFDQVSSIVNTKQAAVSLDGSILDANKLGFDFDGWFQLDYGNPHGMGSILFNEYKSDSEKISNNHQVDISIDDFDENHAKNNMLFQYSNPLTGDGTPLRGKFTLKTFDDLIDLAMNLIQKQDRRFMKFLDDILNELRASILVTILQSKDYLQLSNSSFIKKIAQNENGDLDIIISKTLVPLDLIDSDIHLRLTFKNDSKNQKCLKGVSVVDLVMGEKTINANINLDDYVAEKANPVDTSKTFMNFSDLGVLLNFGINTMELNVYHLTGLIKVNALSFINLTINADFYIYVNGATTKVYGYMPDLPKPSISGLFCTMNSEFVFEPDHNASDNDIGGYFYILRDEDHLLSIYDKQYYYRTDSKSFLDDILNYLLVSMLGSSDVIANLGDLDIGSSTETNPAYENLFTEKGFQYKEDNGIHTWDIGIDLGMLTSNDSFSNLDVQLTGKEVNGLGYYSNLKAKTKILVIDIDADINLVDPSPLVEDWPANIESRYQRIVGFYNGLSSSNQAKAMAGAKSGGYSCSRGTI